MSDLFLSYSRDDRVFMHTLRNNLARLGFNVWIDEEGLAVGTPDWERAIEDAVQSVGALVVILSPSAKNSEWVNNELEMAQLYTKPIFPVLAFGDKKTSVPIKIIRKQYADMTGRADYEAGFRNLVKALAKHFGLIVGEFSIDFTGEPRVQVQVYHNEGQIVVVGRDVSGELNVAGNDVNTAAPPTPPGVGSKPPVSAAPPAGATRESPPKDTVKPMFAGHLETRLIRSDPILDLLPTPFAWCDIPAGRVTLENDVGTFGVAPFKLAKYPISYAQFQVFTDAKDGFYNPAWRDGLAVKADHWQQPGEQQWRIDNHPCENVSWYHAVAFCRWLTNRVGYEVRLSTEWEWQWAAQGPDGREYPWGNAFDPARCNFKSKGTTPVDKYPQGASPFEALDMTGNVWEWCLNTSDPAGNTSISGNENRALRGGSWRNSDSNILRATARDWGLPTNMYGNRGFRCALSL